MLTCRSLQGTLPAARTYANLLKRRHPTRDGLTLLLSARAEHAVARLLGSLDSCLENQALEVPTLHDFVYVPGINVPAVLIDVKSRWSASDACISDHAEPEIVYVFVHPSAGQRAVQDDIDYEFVIDGWCMGSELELAAPYLRSRHACPVEKLRPGEDLFV